MWNVILDRDAHFRQDKVQRNPIYMLSNVFTGETDFRIKACFFTFARGAVKTSQTQLLAVHMCRQLLKEGGGDWDRNITRAPNQHMDTGEVKEGHVKALAWESGSSSHHTSIVSSICVFIC